LFLAVLQGDSSGLQRDFELSLSGDAQHWKLTLTFPPYLPLSNAPSHAIQVAQFRYSRSGR
jgi:hypothetical protein